MQQKKIASVGAVYLDINVAGFSIPLDANQLIERETVSEQYELSAGGSAVNFTRICKSLDFKVIFIGKTGSDINREILFSFFAKEGIIPILSEDANLQTNINVNLASLDGKSIMLSFGNANQSLSSEDVMSQLKNLVPEVDILYIGGAFKLTKLLPSLENIIDFINSKGKVVVLDHGRILNTTTEDDKATVRQVAKKVSYYLPSKDEFLELWNINSIEEGLRLFENEKVKVVVKNAENGAWTLQGSEIIHVPAFSVKPLNIIGAGDSFNAGFITSASNGKSLEDSVRFASATAALKISIPKTPTKEMLDDFLSSNS